MKKLLAAAAVCGIFASAGTAGAANMMMEKMQCSAACNTQYMQCVMAANQLTSAPAEALNQIKTNFQGSTACGQEAIACQQSCN